MAPPPGWALDGAVPRRELDSPFGKLLDQESLVDADPCAGMEVGSCEVIRRLSPGEPRALLGLRAEGDRSSLVLLERATGSFTELSNRARALSLIQQPHVARVYDCEVAEDEIFWVTEFAPGAALAEVAEACRKKGMAMPLGVALPAIHEAALAVDSLRSQAVPLTLRGRDVVVTFRGSTKLVCFALSHEEPRRGGPGFGAPSWGVAPDLFSLGAILYECLGGDALTSPPSLAHWVPPSKLNVSVPNELDEVVERALQLEGAERFHSPKDLARALKDAAGAFMWRESQRADFVAKLFPTRWRRIQVLLAGCTTGVFRALEAPRASQKPPPLAARILTGVFRVLESQRSPKPEAPVTARLLPPPLPRRRAARRPPTPAPLPTVIIADAELRKVSVFRRTPPPRVFGTVRAFIPAPRPRPARRRRFGLGWLLAGLVALGAGAGAFVFAPPSRPDLDRAQAWAAGWVKALAPCNE